MITLLAARRSASRVSAWRALASFLAASLAAFSRAVMERVERFAFRASVAIVSFFFPPFSLKCKC